MLGRILLVGVGLGLLTAFLLVRWLRRYWIPDFLHSPVFLAAAFFAGIVLNLTLLGALAGRVGLYAKPLAAVGHLDLLLQPRGQEPGAVGRPQPGVGALDDRGK